MTKFYNIGPSACSTAVKIFMTIDAALMKYNITWDKCVFLAAALCYNTSVNTGRNKSVIAEATKKNTPFFINNPCLTLAPKIV